jgi:hypothetical protein
MTGATGGTKIAHTEALTENSPALISPVYSDEAWQRITREELMRFYSPKNPAAVERSWRGVFTLLKQLKAEVESRHARLGVVIYPSRLQIEKAELDAAVSRFSHSRAPYFSRESVDLSLPARTMRSFCQAEHLSCFDITDEVRREHEQNGKSLYVPRDTHWNIAGNAVAAEAEAAQLAPFVCSPQ